MTDRIRDACEAQFERDIAHYADCVLQGRGLDDRAFNDIVAKYPDDPVPCLQAVLDLVLRAHRARDWFAKHGPAEYQPLPLKSDEQETIICGSYFDRHIMVYYADSLKRSKYDYLRHPLFYDYARGVLAHPDCPAEVATDEDARREFPPKVLPGLDSEMVWSPTRGTL
jgi:hypothetical protein